MDVLSKLQDIFRDIFDDESLVITEDTASNHIEDWDSLAQINIVVTVEGEFGIKFDLNEIGEFNSVSQIVRLIEGKLKDL